MREEERDVRLGVRGRWTGFEVMRTEVQLYPVHGLLRWKEREEKR